MKYTDGITIITPVYNAEKSLKKCVDSIINQEYRECFLLLVDDGSTDSSPDICDEYAQNYSNITVIHKTNGGVSSARNVGIREVNTKYFVFVDSDDYVSDNYLSILIDAKNKYPNNTVWSGIRTVSDLNGHNPTDYLAGCEQYFHIKKEEFITILSYYIGQGPVGKLFESETVITNALLMDESISYGEDLTFNLQYLDVVKSDTITVVNIASYNYVQNSGSLSHKYDRNLKEKFEYVNDLVYKYALKWNVSESQLDLYYKLVFGKYVSLFNHNMSSDNDDKFFDKIEINNDILRSEKYKCCYNHSKNSLSFVNRIIYSFNNYLIIYYLNKAFYLFKRVVKRLRSLCLKKVS